MIKNINHQKINTPNKKEQAEFSRYTKKLINDTEKTLEKIFPGQKEMNNELEKICLAVNMNLLITSIIFLYQDLKSEERQTFIQAEENIKKILLSTVEKSKLKKEKKKSLTNLINSLNSEDFKSQYKLSEKLNSADPENLMYEFKKNIVILIKKNKEVLHAFLFLILKRQ